MKAMDNNQKDRIMNKFIYLLACTLFVSCQNNNKSSVTQMEVELDSMWCTRLMPGLGSGVTGGAEPPVAGNSVINFFTNFKTLRIWHLKRHLSFQTQESLMY